MHFDLDSEERGLVDEAASTITACFSGRPAASAVRPDAWGRFFATGWLRATYQLPSADQLPLPRHLLVHLAKAAGRMLIVEEFTNNCCLLPGLMCLAEDPRAAITWLNRDAQQPGYLVVDGRALRLDAARSERVGWVFGADDSYTAYEFDQSPGQWALRRVGARVEICSTGLLAGPARAVERTDVLDELTLLSNSTHLSELLDTAMLVHTAALLGLADFAVAQVCDFGRNREQFDQPILQFQANKHVLADIHGQLTAAWLAVECAALPDAGTTNTFTARLLTLSAIVAVMDALSQLYGAIGTTSEFHWYAEATRLLAGARRFGSPQAVMTCAIDASFPRAAQELVKTQ